MNRIGLLCIAALLAAVGSTAWADSGDGVFLPVGAPFDTDSWSQYFGTTVGSTPHIDLIQVQIDPLSYAPFNFSFDNAVGDPGISRFEAGSNTPTPAGAPSDGNAVMSTWRQIVDTGQVVIAAGSASDPGSWIEAWFTLNFSGSMPTTDTLPAGDFLYLDVQAYQTLSGTETLQINESVRYGVDTGWEMYLLNTKTNLEGWYNTSDYVGSEGYEDLVLGNGLWAATAPVPEPVTMMGVLMGVGALGRYWSRKRRTA